MAVTLRDRLWLWGMQVNVLQSNGDLGWADSTMTTEDAIGRTGITNVLMAGLLPLTRETLDAMPSAKRIICKWGIHNWQGDETGGATLDYEKGRDNLLRAKELARMDTRIDAYLLDDFSTGAIKAGVKPEHIARLQFENMLHGPQLPLMCTVYTMTLDDERLGPLLPYFSAYLTPLWHSADIDKLPRDVARLAALSGNKPQLLCIYLYDFGNGKHLSYELMRRQLDALETLLRQRKVYGSVVLGTCMMDLDWESNRAFYDWLDEKGDDELE